MPIWMRQLHIRAIQQYLEEKQEAIEKEHQKYKTSPKASVKGPNINPSSVYNFKK